MRTGADLAARRAELKLSQPRLAELSGIQQSEISRIETGAANPTLLTIVRLSQVLGLRVALVAADAAEPDHATA
jgi:transcriptional regulator with XRE-family HTH domain